MIGYIHSIESMGLVDGPGIRTVVFLQGCRLRCAYCHNPDTWAMPGRDASGNPETESCRGKPVEKMTPEELVNRLLRFKNYYGRDGGVTFSGGEPLLQDGFLLECLKLCKSHNINTCIDTAGVGRGNYGEILEYTDLVIYDVKHVDPDAYRELTGSDIGESLKFLETAQKMNKDLWIRHVVVPGITDGEEHLKKVREYVSKLGNVKKTEFLPYHTLGVHKYDEMGLPYRLPRTSGAGNTSGNRNIDANNKQNRSRFPGDSK